MTEKILLEYGMKYIGEIYILNNDFIIDLKDDLNEVSALTECVYAFIIDNEIVRIGSSMGVLKGRFHRWQKDVSNALKNLKSHTSTKEAEEWRALLKNKKGKVYARQGHAIVTPAGEIRAFLSEEKHLIIRHKPRFSKR